MRHWTTLLLCLMTQLVWASEKEKVEVKIVEAVIETDLGDLEVELFYEKAPSLVSNFIELSQKDFYHNTYVYNLINNVAIEMGAKKKSGDSTAGYTIDDHFDKSLNYAKAGMLAYVNTGPDMSSSNFMITLAPTPHFYGKYPVFGQLKNAEETLKTWLEKFEKSKDKNPKIKNIKILTKNVKPKKFIKLTPFSTDDIEKLTIDKARSLLQLIFKEEKLGNLKELKMQYKSIRGRRVQVAYEATSSEKHLAKIILLGKLTDKSMEIQQFQYQQLKD